jgi:hypothetical protein
MEYLFGFMMRLILLILRQILVIIGGAGKFEKGEFFNLSTPCGRYKIGEIFFVTNRFSD